MCIILHFSYRHATCCNHYRPYASGVSHCLVGLYVRQGQFVRARVRHFFGISAVRESGTTKNTQSLSLTHLNIMTHKTEQHITQRPTSTQQDNRQQTTDNEPATINQSADEQRDKHQESNEQKVRQQRDKEHADRMP